MPILIKPNEWLLESRSNPGNGRRVRMIAGRLWCDCPGYEYRRRCFHVASVELLLDTEKAQRPLSVRETNEILFGRQD